MTIMPRKGSSPKSRGGKKDSAAKNTFNPPAAGGRKKRGSQTAEPSEQDTKRRIGQFSGAGEPPLTKK
jgi:hypothetical protein